MTTDDRPNEKKPNEQKEKNEMVDILHRVGAVAPREKVYDALTTIEGVAGWWSKDAEGDPGTVGEMIRFGFEPGSAVAADATFRIKVLETKRDELVRWEVVEGPPEWIGTELRFDIAQEDEYAIVRFGHLGWKEPGAFMAHCSTKWAIFMMSLKQLAETGTGAPAPVDVQISNWH